MNRKQRRAQNKGKRQTASVSIPVLPKQQADPFAAALERGKKLKVTGYLA